MIHINNVETQIAIAKYIYAHPSTKNMSALDIYNGWCEEYNTSITSSSFLFDMLNVIDRQKNMDRDLLKSCIEYDEKEILPHI